MPSPLCPRWSKVNNKHLLIAFKAPFALEGTFPFRGKRGFSTLSQEVRHLVYQAGKNHGIALVGEALTQRLKASYGRETFPHAAVKLIDIGRSFSLPNGNKCDNVLLIFHVRGQTSSPSSNIPASFDRWHEFFQGVLALPRYINSLSATETTSYDDWYFHMGGAPFEPCAVQEMAGFFSISTPLTGALRGLHFNPAEYHQGVKAAEDREAKAYGYKLDLNREAHSLNSLRPIPLPERAASFWKRCTSIFPLLRARTP